MKTRASWGSRAGFIFAAAGSAVGLANIWRFPYMVGSSGGAGFIGLYLICLALIGFPVFLAEVLIGRSSQTAPASAFSRLGGGPLWRWVGKGIILTGFLVSAFYSAVAGTIVGYFVEALRGNLTIFSSAGETVAHHASLVDNPWWTVSFHFAFILMSTFILISGVRKGIERASKIFMPLLYIILIGLVIKGISLPHSWDGIKFLFSPDWSQITPMVILLALGQSFFTLSIGQGTMITYGSYLPPRENVVTCTLPVVFMDTLVSLLTSIAIFTIVFSVGLKPDAGPALIFHTLPLVFSQLPGGYFLAILFFLLVFIAAITSEISAMEPSIAYLIDEKKMKRSTAVVCVASGAFLVGIPCALSWNILSGFKIFGRTILELMDFMATSLLIPAGGLAAVLFVGWFWTHHAAFEEARKGNEEFFTKHRWFAFYFKWTIKVIAPLLILLVFLSASGILG